MLSLVFPCVFLFGLVLGLPVKPMEPVRQQNLTHQLVEDQNRQVRAVAALITDNTVNKKITSLIETSSVQEIQTIKDYLEQLKNDIRKGASSYVQDSVAMMEELTTAIKHLKKKIEVTVDRVNSKAESKLLAIKAIEELIGFSAHEKKHSKSFVEKNAKNLPNENKSFVVAGSLLEVRSVQEIQTIKDYLEQLKSDIRSGVTSYVQDSVAMMEELTTAIKNLKKKIEGTVNRVNSHAESKLLAIKAIEELIGFSKKAKSLIEKNN
jgi:uncharacterized protein Yka (UPF0111/DUF47 family)